MKNWLFSAFHYHSQNIAKEDRKDLEEVGKTYKGDWLSWRCWWTAFKKPCRFHISSGFRFAAGVEFDYVENEIQFHLAPIYFNLFFTIGGLLPNDWKRGKRELGFSLYHDFFWIYLWSAEDGYGSRKRDWRHITIRWKDILFGESTYNKELIGTETFVLTLPEASYPTKVEFYRVRHGHSRWPFTKEAVQADIKPEKPIIVPGKGENSWDCGDDHTHSLWCEAKTVGEAMGKLYDTVASTRARHGSGVGMYAKDKVS